MTEKNSLFRSFGIFIQCCAKNLRLQAHNPPPPPHPWGVRVWGLCEMEQKFSKTEEAQTWGFAKAIEAVVWTWGFANKQVHFPPSKVDAGAKPTLREAHPWGVGCEVWGTSGVDGNDQMEPNDCLKGAACPMGAHELPGTACAAFKAVLTLLHSDHS